MSDVWKPQVGFQTVALDARYVIDEMGMLGDRGGGKSSVLLVDYAMGLQDTPYLLDEHGEKMIDPDPNVKGPLRPWKGILFRRHFAEFETLIQRSKEIYYGLYGDRARGGRCHYLEGDKKWLFFDERGDPYPDISLQFFHMEHDADVDQWIGTEWQWVGFDELPQWSSPKPYLRMMSSVRCGVPGIPMRVRFTGNPGGAGIGWIKRRFQIPDGSKEKIIEAALPNPYGMAPIEETDPRSGKKLTRMFLLSLREENLLLKHADPLYEARLAASVEGDPELEKAWVDADFSALFGQYFKVFDSDVHRVDDPLEVLPDGRVPPFWKLYGHLDYGENAPTAFGLWAVDPDDNKYLIDEYYVAGEWAGYHASGIRDLCKNSPWTGGRMPQTVFADSQIWHTRAAENIAARNKTVADVFTKDGGLRLRPSIKGPGSRVRGWRHLKQCLAHDEVKKPSVRFFAHCEHWEREVRNAIYSETGDKEDIDKGCEDHHLTGTIYFLGGAYKGKLPAEEVPESASYPTMAYYAEQRKVAARGGQVESFIVPGGKHNVDQMLLEVA